MAEYIPSQPRRRQGHLPNTDYAIVELHRLLAIFLSSKNFAKLSQGFNGEQFDPIEKIQDVEEDESARILLTLAITARVIGDEECGKFSEGSDCGTLQADNLVNKNIPLTLREACNKLIHATKIQGDIEGPEGRRYRLPTIYLYGSFNQKQWRAELDVIKFCKAYITAVDSL